MTPELDGLTDEQRKTFYYLWAKDGEAEAKKYLADPEYQQERFVKARGNVARGNVYAGMQNAEDFGEQVTNGQRLYRAYMQNVMAAGRGEDVSEESTGVQYIGHEGLAEDLAAMTEDERNTFYYLWGKGSEKDAAAYREFLRPELDSRIAKAEGEKVKNMEPGLGKTMQLAAIGTLGSAAATVGELPYMFKNEEVPEDRTRQFVQEAGSNLTGVPYYLYEASKTLGGQLPAITASAATGDLLGTAGASAKVVEAVAKTVGAAVMGLGAAGRAKQEMLREGYSLDAANAVGVLTGVSETTLERVLGGIDKFSGGKGLSSVMKKNISGIRSGVVRWLLTHGANVLDEITEEELQLVLEPLFKSLVTSAEFEAPMAQDYIDTAITTALSTFALNLATGTRAEAYNPENDKGLMRKAERQQARVKRYEEQQKKVAEWRQDGRKSPEEQVREAFERRNAEVMRTRETAQTGAQGATAGASAPVSPAEMVQRAARARTARNETQRTGILTGAKDEDIAVAEALSTLTGRKIVFEEPNNVYQNGRYQKSENTIYINPRGADPMAQIMSHELTHSIEIADAYEKLSTMILKRIGKTQDLAALRAEKKALYERYDVTLADADIDYELVAEYASKHLFTDEQSIIDLVQRDQNLGWRIYNWLSGLLRRVSLTAKGREAAFIRRARSLYAKALRQTMADEASTAKGEAATYRRAKSQLDADLRNGLISDEEYDAALNDVMRHGQWEELDRPMSEAEFEAQMEKGEEKQGQYSITEIIDENGKSYGVGVLLDSTLLDNLSESERKIMVRERIKELGGAPFTAYDLNGKTIIISIAEPKEKFINEKGKKRNVNRDLATKFIGRNIKQETVVLADELIQTSIFEEKSAAKHKHDWLDNDGKNEWDVRKTFVKDKDDTIWEATLKIANATDGRKILYDIDPIKKVGRSGESDTFPTYNSISSNEENVNNQFSFYNDPDEAGYWQSLNRARFERDSAQFQRTQEEVVQENENEADWESRLEDAQKQSRQKRSREKEQPKGPVDESLEGEERDDDYWYELQQQELQQALAAERRKYAQEEKERQKRIEEQKEYIDDFRAGRESGEIESAVGKLKDKAKEYLMSGRAYAVKQITNQLEIFGKENRDALRQTLLELAEEQLYYSRMSDYSVQQAFEKVWEMATRSNREYVEQYADVKKVLNKDAVVVSESIQAEIPDYRLWAEDMRGKMQLVSARPETEVEGQRNISSKDFAKKATKGMPADVKYKQLNDMAPELFPESITNPTERLLRMAEVAERLKLKTEWLARLDRADERDFLREVASYDFREAMERYAGKINRAAQWNSERTLYEAKRKTEDEEVMPKTIDEVFDVYDKLKKARREYERIRARIMLTPAESMAVGAILRGEAKIENFNPKLMDVKAIEQVVKAKSEYEKYARKIRAYNAAQRTKRAQRAQELLANADDWKDKVRAGGFRYSVNTQERNIRDIVKNPEDAERIIAEYFAPVHKNTAAANRFKNEYRNRVEKLGLSREVKEGDGYSESAAVQIIGEARYAMDTITQSEGRIQYIDGKDYAEWKAMVDSVVTSSPSLDMDKISDAIREFRKIYDELYRRMNEVRVRNGYEPTGYIKGYFPHFRRDADDALSAFAKALGIEMEVTELPTTIAGRTHMFKPRKAWFAHEKKRTGIETEHDAVEGFDRYIEGVADVIFHTDDIGKIRTLANEIRMKASDDTLKEYAEKELLRTDITDDEKRENIRDKFEKARYGLSNYVQNLDEYANLLANKKSKADRQFEQEWGRTTFNFVKAVENAVAANTIGLNIGSWLTNYIPLTQAWGAVEVKYLLRGIGKATANQWSRDLFPRLFKKGPYDDFRNKSDFLTNRRGSTPLVQNWRQKTSEYVSTPMEWIDMFVAESITRGRYLQNVEKGRMSEEAAMEDANAYAASLIADRSKGALPTIFHQRNPLKKLITMYQTEVNNQYHYFFKDLPRITKKEEKSLKLALLRIALSAFLYNEFFELLVGRRAATDILNILNESSGDIFGYELPNTIELAIDALQGNEITFKTNKLKGYDLIESLAKRPIEEVPFVGGLLGGGRIPISSALPSVKNLINAQDSEKSPKTRNVTAIKEWSKPVFYLAPPFGGGGQIKKTASGIIALAKGGSYTVDNEGNEILQYPVKRNVGTIAQTALFGKSATIGSRKWVESGFASLTAGQTQSYKKMVDLGEDEIKVYDFLRKLSSVEKSEQHSKQVEQIRAISESKFSEEAKQEAVRSLFSMSESGREQEARFDDLIKMGLEVEDYLQLREEDSVDRYEKFADGGMSSDASVNLAQRLQEAEQANGDEKKLTDNEKYRVIFEGEYSTKDTEAAIRATMSEKNRRKVQAAEDYGVDHTLWADFKLSFEVVYPGKDPSVERTVKVLRVMELTNKQRAALFQMTMSNVKPENNPFDARVAKSVQEEIERTRED